MFGINGKRLMPSNNNTTSTSTLYCCYCKEYVFSPHNCKETITTKPTAHNNFASMYHSVNVKGTGRISMRMDNGKMAGRRKASE